VHLTHEKIKECAYGLYLERNGNDGSELKDWLDAEKEIKRGNAKTIEKNNMSRSHRQR
jgi:hypothetical protein